MSSVYTVENILKQLIPYLTNNGREFKENINKSYDHAQINAIYERMKENSVEMEQVGVGQSVAVLRKYLNELIVPLTQNISITSSVTELRTAVDNLTIDVSARLDYIIYFAVSLIHNHKEEIHLNTVARFLAPLLFRKNTEHQHQYWNLKDLESRTNVVKSMILNYNEVFSNIMYKQKQERESESASASHYVTTLLDVGAHVKNIARGVKILCLDGGGIRGLVLVRILAKIAEKMFGNCDLDGTEKLLKCFDLVCGTSTGAILAVSLSTGKLSLKSARETYYKISKNIFSFGYTYVPYRWGRYYWDGDYYNSKLLKNLLKEEFGDHEFKTLRHNLFVTTSDVSTLQWRTALIRSYDNSCSPYESIREASIPDALRMSSAAPTYFSAVKSQNRIYIDGGMTANNPTEIGIFEAHNKWPDKYIDLILSVGTGIPDEGKGSVNLLSLFSGLVNIATSSNDIHLRVEEWLQMTSPEPQYYRFSPPGLGSIRLDESNDEILAELELKTELYMDAQKEVVDKLIERLCTV